MNLLNFKRKFLVIPRFCKDFLFYIAGNLYLKRNKFDIKVLTIAETISIAKEKSIIRFGDGEIAIMNGKNIVYQPFNEELANNLLEIVNSKNKDVLICLPNIFGDMNDLRFKDKYFHTKFLFQYRNYFKNEVSSSRFGNTFMSRPYMIFKDKEKSEEYFLKIKELWNQKDIVIVEGEKSKSGVGNTLFSNTKSIERIICPSENAFSKSEDIMIQIQKMDKNKLFLFALGPTAKIIIYDLVKLGYRAIDIGHLDSEYEWSLRKAKDKIKINGKHTAEFKDDVSYQDFNDQDYLQQVVKVVK